MGNEFQQLTDSALYKNASLAEQIQMLIDLKHHSLDSGADANVELFKLIPKLCIIAERQNKLVEFIVDEGSHYFGALERSPLEVHPFHSIFIKIFEEAKAALEEK